MLFELKKFVGGILMPLPLLLLLMAIALLLLWCKRSEKSAKAMLSLCWLTLLLLSMQPVADRLLLPLESTYATYGYDGRETSFYQHDAVKNAAEQAKTPIRYIVVLGGGYTYNPAWAPSSNLLHNSLPRVAEGIRLYLDHPGSKLVFTGAASGDNPHSSAETAARVAESLGVPRADIITLDKPRDTEQEAAQVALLLGEQPFLLVTSANHLPRAIRFFQAQGLHPLPAPANQLAITSPLNMWEKIFPSSLYLGHSERAWYETLGSWWQSSKRVDKQSKE